MMDKEKKNIYMVAGRHSWNRRVFDEVISKYHGDWDFIQSRQELNLEYIKNLNPRYIFFLHWSWKIPVEIIDNYECVCFHMTDVPYGRGGSPLQNLIIRGHRNSKLTALRMISDFDAGPVYFKEDLCLEGSAEEIYMRATYLAAQMIKRLISEEPDPNPQIGDPVIFSRRRPEESEIPETASLQQLYDFIRMLDAEDYPKAFIDHQGFRYEFGRAALYEGRIVADVTVYLVKKDS